MKKIRKYMKYLLLWRKRTTEWYKEYCSMKEKYENLFHSYDKLKTRYDNALKHIRYLRFCNDSMSDEIEFWKKACIDYEKELGIE